MLLLPPGPQSGTVEGQLELTGGATAALLARVLLHGWHFSHRGSTHFQPFGGHKYALRRVKASGPRWAIKTSFKWGLRAKHVFLMGTPGVRRALLPVLGQPAHGLGSQACPPAHPPHTSLQLHGKPHLVLIKGNLCAFLESVQAHWLLWSSHDCMGLRKTHSKAKAGCETVCFTSSRVGCVLLRSPVAFRILLNHPFSLQTPSFESEKLQLTDLPNLHASQLYTLMQTPESKCLVATMAEVWNKLSPLIIIRGILSCSLTQTKEDIQAGWWSWKSFFFFF